MLLRRRLLPPRLFTVLSLATLSLTALSLVTGCDDVPEDGVVLTPASSPERTAAQDRALRALVMDIAEARACADLRERFFPLPEDGAQGGDEAPDVEGRLWIGECAVERRGERLAIDVSGRGWQWIERSSEGPLGSSFTVRGYVRFQAAIELEAEVDLRYDERGHRAQLALTPHGGVAVRLSTIGPIPVAADGGWSGVVGGIGSLLGGGSLEERARPIVETEGSAMIRSQLREGLTVSFDLCGGQLDASLGSVRDGAPPPARPYPDEEGLWLDNARVELRPGGVDLSGPWPTEGRRVTLDLEVTDGDRAEASLVCKEEAALIASEVLAGGAAPAGDERVTRAAWRGRAITLALAPGACAEAVLMVRAAGEVPVRYRYRLRREGDEREDLVRCGR